MKTTINYFGRMLCVFLLSVGVALTSCEEEPQPIAVQSVSLDKTSIEITVGETLKLTATVAPDNADNPAVAWTSSDPGVASVQDGIVTAHKEGMAKITVRTNDGGKTATCDVTVIPKTYPVESVSLDKTSYEMAIGDEVTLTATVTPDNATNKSVTWSSSDIAVATVDNGKVTAVSPGEATITVTTEDGGKTAICKVTVKADPVVFALDKVTAATASFSGHLNVPAADIPYCQITVYYSDAETFSINDALSASVTSFDNEQNFTISLTDLKHDTRYNYCMVAEVKSEKIYGDIKNFTTTEIGVSLTPKESNIISGSPIAEFNLIVTGLTEEDHYTVGVLFSSSENLSYDDRLYIYPNITSDGSYTIKAYGLETDSKYYYCYYIRDYYGKAYTYGDTEEINTTHPYSIPADLDMSSAKNLSSSGTANSYIVSEAGLYKIKAVTGNVDNPWTVLENAVSGSILWECIGEENAPNFNELITSVSYKDGYLAFQVAEPFKEGNALIAVKDSENKILWSWHIWLTDEPQCHTYSDGSVMMDRNLGATSTIPGEPCYGMLYQWGRKDPFPGSAVGSVIGEHFSTAPRSATTTPIEIAKGEPVTTEFVNANPTTFIFRENGEWYDNEVSMPFLWQDSKTIYDPCPVGWKVPAYYPYVSTKEYVDGEGLYFKISSTSTAFYPFLYWNYYGVYTDPDLWDAKAAYWTNKLEPNKYGISNLFFTLFKYDYSSCETVSINVIGSAELAVRCEKE